MTSGQLLTTRHVAEHLEVSTETVLRWTRRGDLPAIRLPGGALRFEPGTLTQWLAERTTQNEQRPGDDSPGAAKTTMRGSGGHATG